MKKSYVEDDVRKAWRLLVAFVLPFIIACWVGLAWLIVEFWRSL